MRFFYILTSFPGYFVSVSVGKMSSTRASYLLWVTLSLLLLRCPGLTLLLLEAEEVALVEVYLEQPSHVSALLHGQVVESSRDSGNIEHQDDGRETLEGELVLVSLSNMEFVLLLVITANKTLIVCKIEEFFEKEDIKKFRAFIIYLLCCKIVTLVSFI